MKTLKLLGIVLALFTAGILHAQVAVNINMGAPPKWGPAGYSGVKYYYLPDVEAYYDVPSSNFIYLERGKWVHHKNLPSRYRNYDLYSGYKVVMTDYHGKTPYYQHNDFKKKYAKGYHGSAQKNIGEKLGKGNSKGNSQFKNQSYKAPGYSKVKSGVQRNGNKQNGNGHSGGHGKKK